MASYDDHTLAELERNKRWRELAQALEARAEQVAAPEQRADLLARAMVIYRDRFAHMALAIVVAEQILELTPDRTAVIEFLRDAYTKQRRRDKLDELDARLRGSKR
jgi:hypothetical protein